MLFLTLRALITYKAVLLTSRRMTKIDMNAKLFIDTVKKELPIA